MLDGLDNRLLLITTITERAYSNHVEKKLVLTDPLIGKFSATLFVPNVNKDTSLAVVILKGHKDHGTSFGKTLAEQGFVAIVPHFRAMNYNLAESNISEELYMNGFTLMGLRVYETHLIIKYLKSLEYVDERRIGLMGHSGGSTIAYLTSIISPDVHVLVYDMLPDLLDPGPNNTMHCETIPDLAYYNNQIIDPSSMKIPSKMFDYSYKDKDSVQQAVTFLKKKLNAYHSQKRSAQNKNL